jgi:hypothetical protein
MRREQASSKGVVNPDIADTHSGLGKCEGNTHIQKVLSIQKFPTPILR